MTYFNECLTLCDRLGLDEETKLLSGGQGGLRFHISHLMKTISHLRLQIIDLIFQTVLIRIGGGGLVLQGTLLGSSARWFEPGLYRSDAAVR